MTPLEQQAYVAAGRERDRQGQVQNDALSELMRGRRQRPPTREERDAAAVAEYEAAQRRSAAAAKYTAEELAEIAPDLARQAPGADLLAARALLDAEQRARANPNPYAVAAFLDRHGPRLDRAREVVARQTTSTPAAAVELPPVLRQLEYLDRTNPVAAGVFHGRNRGEIARARRTP